ncbi:MAG: carboxymuconolactone decarboxylase family protein [Novosphingobium sp.]|nr:carboxymuconolactone decarboxylase family protein [Novosphingobium sp.]
MPRIPYPDESKMSEDIRAHLGEIPANVTRMMAVASEPVFKGVSQIGSAFIGGSDLPAKLREIAILRVGYISKAEYETFQHEALGRFVGLTDEQIDAVRAGDTGAAALNEVERAVLEFVDDVVLNVRASDATLAGVRKHLTDAQVVDLILVSGAYMMISRFLETTGVELDADPIDWDAFTKSQ